MKFREDYTKLNNNSVLKRAVNIHHTVIVYEKDTDGEYVLNTNGDKIVLESNINNIAINDDWSIKTVITDYEW